MLYVHGAGHFHPENVIDNEFLEALDIGTTNDWIVDRVGIRERHTVLSLDYIRNTRNKNPAAALEAAQYTNAQTGALAAQAALQVAGISAQDVGLVVAGSCTPQSSCPAESCTIAAQAEIDAPSMDINSACSSLAAQLHLLNNMQADALPDYVLVVNADNSTREIDYTDRNSCVLWGDGSSAVVVSPRVEAPMRVVSTSFTSQPSGHDKVQFLQHRHFRQDGRTVQTFAIKRTVSMIKAFRKQLGDADEPLRFIGHQANLAMLQAACRWGSIDADKHFYNVDAFGNCGAAGAPSVLAQNWAAFKPGNKLVIAVVGSGLSWGGALLEIAA
ncbi:MAG: 3-oxoacyl-ACP synthase III family protein [Gammaproteobacteria bacterium]